MVSTMSSRRIGGSATGDRRRRRDLWENDSTPVPTRAIHQPDRSFPCARVLPKHPHRWAGGRGRNTITGGADKEPCVRTARTHRPGGWELPLIAPATGACKLIGPGAGTPIAIGALEGERGAVVGESLQERSPTAETSAKKTASRVGARIKVCRIREVFIIRMLTGRARATRSLERNMKRRSG
jgi:hypothetical protein